MERYTDASLHKGYRMALAVCCLMIASAFMYAAVAEYLAARHAPFAGVFSIPAAAYARVRFVLPGVALVNLALIPFLRHRILKAAARPVGPVASLPEPVIRLMRASVISCALCLSVAIYGLILFIATGDRHQFYLHFALSLAAFAVHFPRLTRWQAMQQRLEIEGRHLTGHV